MSYDAFISYSRAADDDLAHDLQRSLERLSKPWYRRKPFLRILRDTTSFGASSDLNETISGALDEAGHLVLLISPESALSPWTNQEVDHWLATKSAATITTVITGWRADDELLVGELTDLNGFDWNGPEVPAALHKVVEEPLAVDLRWATTATARSSGGDRWIDAVAQIAAAVKGINKDELIGELVNIRTRARIITSSIATGAALLAGSIVVAGVMWALALGERDDARDATAAAKEDLDIAIEDTEAARVETALQEAIGNVRTEANAASRLVGTDLSAALRSAVGALDLAKEVDAQFPSSTEDTGELQALGVVMSALTSSSNLVAQVGGTYADVVASPDGSSFIMLGFGANGGAWMVPAAGPLPSEPIGDVAMAAFAADTDRFALGRFKQVEVHDGDGQVRFLDVPDGAEGLREIALSADGRHVAGAGDNGTVFVWDLDEISNLPARALETGTGYITDIAFHPRAAVIAWSGYAGDAYPEVRSAGLFGVSDGVAISLDPAVTTEEAGQVAFSSACTDRCLLVVTSGRVPAFWSVSSNGEASPVDACPACPAGDEAVAWHSDGTHLAFGAPDGTIRTWALRGDVLVSEPVQFRAERGQIATLTYLGDDVLSATLEPGAISRWSATRRSALALPRTVFEHGSDVLRGIGAVADGMEAGLLATGGSDGAIRLWQSSEGDLSASSVWAPWCSAPCDAPEEVPDNLIANCQGVSGDLIRDLAHVSTTTGSLLAAGSGHDATGCADGHVRLWVVGSDHRLREPATLDVGDRGQIAAVAFTAEMCASGADCLLFAGGKTAPDAADPAHLWAWRWNEVEGEMVPLGALFLAAADSAVVTSIDVTTGPVVTIATSEGVVYSEPVVNLVESFADSDDSGLAPHFLVAGLASAAKVDPAGRGLLVVGGHGGTVGIWSTAGPFEQVGQFGRFSDFITDLTWSVDGRIVIVTSADGNVALFDVSDPAEPVSLTEPLGLHRAAVWAVALSSDGESFVTVSSQARPPEAGIGTIVEWEFGSERLRELACGLGQLGATRDGLPSNSPC